MIKIDTLEIQKNIEEKRQIFGQKFEAFLLRQARLFLKKADDFLGSKHFCAWSISIIFLLSIFLRSRIDIGCDSAFYLDIATKLSEGGKYYYDFFESNFPLPFIIHLIPTYIAKITGFSQIIVADYFVNILGLLSLLFSSRILTKSTLHKTHQNIIISSFALAFFLRVGNLEFGEFMTKTSFYLMLAFPYIAYSFARKMPLNNKQMIWRGLLAGFIPCLKPHYIILPLVIEISRFWHIKSFRFFFQLDKIVMALVGCSYLAFMITFTPEFFEYMVPMWSSFYSVYHLESFINNAASQISFKLIVLGVFLSFLRLKFSSEDRLLFCVAIASSIILIVEAMPEALDQDACFFGLVTAAIGKVFYDFVKSPNVCFNRNKIVLAFLAVAPFVEGSIAFIKSLVVFWWIVLPILMVMLRQKLRHDFPHNIPKISNMTVFAAFISFVLLLIIEIIYLQQNQIFTVIATFIFILFTVLYEKYYATFYSSFSSFFIFIQFFLVIYFLSYYISSISNSFVGSNIRKSPSAVTDAMIEYTKSHVQSENDKMTIITPYLIEKSPVMAYLNQENDSRVQDYVLFNAVIPQKLDRGEEYHVTFQYALHHLKKRISHEDMKLLFIRYSPDDYSVSLGCLIGMLEYYLRDAEFRDIFLNNYHYSGKIMDVITLEDRSRTQLIAQDKGRFASLTPSTFIKSHSYEIYSRKTDD